jgi:hypothetical protein
MRLDLAVHVRLLDALFPVTPTLSLGERENRGGIAFGSVISRSDAFGGKRIVIGGGFLLQKPQRARRMSPPDFFFRAELYQA